MSLRAFPARHPSESWDPSSFATRRRGDESQWTPAFAGVTAEGDSQ
jgi:hypothetical protein